MRYGVQWEEQARRDREVFGLRWPRFEDAVNGLILTLQRNPAMFPIVGKANPATRLTKIGPFHSDEGPSYIVNVFFAIDGNYVKIRWLEEMDYEEW